MWRRSFLISLSFFPADQPRRPKQGREQFPTLADGQISSFPRRCELTFELTEPAERIDVTDVLEDVGRNPFRPVRERVLTDRGERCHAEADMGVVI